MNEREILVDPILPQFFYSKCQEQDGGKGKKDTLEFFVDILSVKWTVILKIPFRYVE